MITPAAQPKRIQRKRTKVRKAPDLAIEWSETTGIAGEGATNRRRGYIAITTPAAPEKGLKK